MAYYDNFIFTSSAEPVNQTVTVKTTDYTIQDTETGVLFSSQGASANIEFTLPEDPEEGFWVDFFHPVLTHSITVVTAGSDKFFDSDDGGEHTSASVVFYGGQCRFWYIGGNRWIEHSYGNWTFSG